jgi:hypothetical protein
MVFAYCSGLTSISIPKSVTSIRERAFVGNSSLTSVTIPSSVVSIGSGAFGNCKNLFEINVETGNSAYYSLDGILFNKDKTRLVQYPSGKTDSNYDIPTSVTEIGGRAFYGSFALKSVTIPNSVKSIGNNAFSGCTGLIKIINKATTPQTIPFGVFNTFDVFRNVDKAKCILYVPAEAVDTYRATDGWKNFVNIRAIIE